MGEQRLAHGPQPRRRQSLRLRGYDYRQSGAYFVTICTYERGCLFGGFDDEPTVVTVLGRIVAHCWAMLPAHFLELELDAFVVMPNHVHGILVIGETAAARRGEAFGTQLGSRDRRPSPNASPLHRLQTPRGTASGSLGAIIQTFKSVSARKINQVQGAPGGRVWQRNYYEHLVRNEDELNRLRQYIIDNPLKWAEDENNPRL